MVEHQNFAKLWEIFTKFEPKRVTRLRAENLAGLAGRVLEVGAGNGANLGLYPAAVTEVVAVEPEPNMLAAAQQKLPDLRQLHPNLSLRVVAGSFEDLSAFPDDTFDALVCCFVLCSVDDVAQSLAEAYRVLRPGGQIRVLEHVATPGWFGRWQQFSDATFWPRVFGGCHTHRHPEEALREAGFGLSASTLKMFFPKLVLVPVAPLYRVVGIKPDRKGNA